MPARDPSAGSTPLSDAVAELIAAYLERPEAPHREAVARVLAGFPGREDEVRARLRALRALGIELGQAADGGVPERLGDFRLIRPLGEGGMGVVYLAEQVSLGREVALKLIRPELLFFPRARERFAREVEAVARLQHPGIVPVHAVGEAQGIPFFAMERFRGCTLGALLERLRARAPESISVREAGEIVRQAAGAGELEAGGRELFSGSWVEVALRIAMQLAEALHHAHGRGIVHRDVKPSNVALTVDGRAMLLDFGLTSSAAAGETLTRTGSAVGTLHYMAPEQLGARGEIDPRTDVYALGVTLYEALTLQVPYLGEQRTGVEYRTGVERRILAGRPDLPRARNRQVPADAQTVCLHAMSREPGLRYATAADFGRDLGHVLARRPIEARPPGALVRARRYVERSPARALALVLGLGLVTVLPSALLLQQLGHNRALTRSRDQLAETVEARDVALRRALLNESVQQQMFAFLNGLFEAVDPAVARGAEPSVRALLDAGAARIDVEFADEPEARAMLRWSVGRVYSSLGDYERAIELLAPAADLFREVLESGTPGRLSEDPEWERRWLVSILQDLGIALTRAPSLERASDALREGLELSRGLSDRSVEPRLLSSLGVVSVDREDWVAAASWFERSLAAYQALATPEPRLMAVPQVNLAWVLPRLGREAEAEALYDRALEILRREPDDPGLAEALNSYSVFLKGAGRLREAREALEEAVGLLRRTLPADSDVLGVSIYNLARLHDDTGDLQGAFELYGEARSILSQRPPEHFIRLLNEANYANALRRRGAPGAAAEVYLAILPQLEARWPEGHPFLADVHTGAAACLRVIGRGEEASAQERRRDEIRAALAPGP